MASCTQRNATQSLSGLTQALLESYQDNSWHAHHRECPRAAGEGEQAHAESHRPTRTSRGRSAFTHDRAPAWTASALAAHTSDARRAAARPAEHEGRGRPSRPQAATRLSATRPRRARARSAPDCRPGRCVGVRVRPRRTKCAGMDGPRERAARSSSPRVPASDGFGLGLTRSAIRLGPLRTSEDAPGSCQCPACAGRQPCQTRRGARPASRGAVRQN